MLRNRISPVSELQTVYATNVRNERKAQQLKMLAIACAAFVIVIVVIVIVTL